MKCASCQKQTNQAAGSTPSNKLPKGWHWEPGTNNPACPACWNAKWVMRAITVPLAGPIDFNDSGPFRDAIKEAWWDSTRLANWAVTQLLKAEPGTTASSHTLGAMSKVYLYGLFVKEYADYSRWNGATAVARQILHWVEAQYRARRKEVHWLRCASAQTFKFPAPYMMDKNTWSMSWPDDQMPIFSVPIGGRRWELAARRDKTIHYQFARLRQIASGQAIATTLSLRGQLIHGDNGRGCLSLRAPTSGERREFRIMAKISAWIPKVQAGMTSGLAGELLVSTMPGSLWCVEQDGHSPMWFHGDQCRQWVVAHRSYLQRTADDTKHGVRIDPARLRILNADREVRCDKHGRRVNTFIDQVTAELADICGRRHVVRVIYRDDCRDWLPDGETGRSGFPWFSLRDKLARKITDKGAVFTYASASDANASGNATAKRPARKKTGGAT